MRLLRIGSSVMTGVMILGLFIAKAQNQTPLYQNRFEEEGIQVDFSIWSASIGDTATYMKVDQDVRFRFEIKDKLSGKGLSGAYPAAWLDPVRDETERCVQKVAAFLEGSILYRADLDLNVYYVIALNEDNTLSVVDPLFGYGGSKLLAQVLMNAPGYDWDGYELSRRLLVTLPTTQEVAVVNTTNWEVETHTPIPGKPEAVVIQPDGAYAWVGYTGKERSGVAILDVVSGNLIKTIPTGAGSHDIVFSDDERYVFVTNSVENTVTVIDLPVHKVLKQIAVAPDPVSIDWSGLANAAYVAHDAGGAVTVVAGSSLSVIAEISAEPGLNFLRITPDQRLAFVTNPYMDVVHIVDVAQNRIVQTGDMEDQPDAVYFSDDLAYIRHRNSEIVYMISLSETGREGEPVQVVDFPGGDFPVGAMSMPTRADGIVQAVGATAMLVANPKDKAIYFYKEGMAAPMGEFKNYGKQPRAVTVVDRSLQEVTPGVYETYGKLRTEGPLTMAFFMNAPRLTTCFDGISVRSTYDQKLAKKIKTEGPLIVQYGLDSLRVKVGDEVPLVVQLSDQASLAKITNLNDVGVMWMTEGGQWHNRSRAKPVPGKEGQYKIALSFPKPGLYFIYVQSPSKGLKYSNPQYLMVEAVSPTGDKNILSSK